jgi:hypothetical protein
MRRVYLEPDPRKAAFRPCHAKRTWRFAEGARFNSTAAHCSK